MKKIILSLVAIAAFGVANAQEKNEGGQTSKGKWLLRLILDLVLSLELTLA